MQACCVPHHTWHTCPNVNGASCSSARSRSFRDRSFESMMSSVGFCGPGGAITAQARPFSKLDLRKVHASVCMCVVKTCVPACRSTHSGDTHVYAATRCAGPYWPRSARRRALLLRPYLRGWNTRLLVPPFHVLARLLAHQADDVEEQVHLVLVEALPFVQSQDAQSLAAGRCAAGSAAGDDTRQ
eukprot:366197-Chlamydomonas_euryale.AAC.19